MNYPVLKINNYKEGAIAPLFMTVTDESEIQAKVLREEQELTGEWGRMLTDTVVIPGCCIQYGMFYIKTPVNIINVASEPVLNLHIQAKQELTYRVEGHWLSTFKENTYTPFVQGDKKVTRLFYPGDYLLLNCFFTPRFLTEHIAKRYSEQTRLNSPILMNDKTGSVDNREIIVCTDTLNRFFQEDSRLAGAYTRVVVELLRLCIR